MTAVATFQTFAVNQGVKNLEPVLGDGMRHPYPPGYLFNVVEDRGETVVIRRMQDDRTEVSKSIIEPAYQIYNGTSYDFHTPLGLCKLLDSLRAVRSHVHVHYGYTEHHEEVKKNPALLGRDWLEENDVEGKIGRSTGSVKIPLMVGPMNDGGPSLLDGSIVKITTLAHPRRVIYQHPNYHHGKVTVRAIAPGEGYTDSQNRKVDLFADGLRVAVDVDGENQANFKSQTKADQYLRKLNLTVSK